MTKFLISIRNPQEAILLARFPVGVIDLKNPAKGGLGRLEENEIPSIVDQLDDSVPKSIAFGELLEIKASFPPEYFKTWGGLKNFAFVKFGLAGVTDVDTGNEWKSIWLEYQKAISTLSSLVAVFYSDWKTCAAPCAEEVLELASSSHRRSFKDEGDEGDESDQGSVSTTPHHLLIDTFDKSKGTSIEWLGWSGIELLIQKCNENGIKTVVAGSIGLQDLERLISLKPDYIGLRGAVCRRGREELDESRLAALYSSIQM